MVAADRSNGTKAKIRNLMAALFNHAIRWEFTDRNPITGPVRGSGVRQSSKRARIPDVLTIEEMRMLLQELSLRERVLIFLAVPLDEYLAQDLLCIRSARARSRFAVLRLCQFVSSNPGSRTKKGTIMGRNLPVVNRTVFHEDLKRISTWRDPEDHMAVLTCHVCDTANCNRTFGFRRR